MVASDNGVTRITRVNQVTHWTLVGVESFVAVGALYGGVGLILGNAINISNDWLADTPFETWTLPGIFLLIIVALPMTVAAISEIRRSRWAYAASLAAGSAQIGWIVAQWLIMQRFFVLQPVMFAAGACVLVLAWAAHRRTVVARPQVSSSADGPHRVR